MHHKFDIDDTARILLQIEGRRGLEGIGSSAGSGFASAEVIAHLGAHLAHLGSQLGQIALAAEHRQAHLFEGCGHPRRSHQHPRTHQRLVLPGPGLVLLITLECAE
ncbi:hypothetical protein D9M71_208950 [compost metagenome]